MILFPAIDLKDGACVRLLRGNMSQATVFNNSPANQARLFTEIGCTWIHVVDLNGACIGYPVNTAAVNDILTSTNVSIQLGGGIRELTTIASWLERGVQRVILGTIAVRDPKLVKTACSLFPGQIAVGIDVRDGLVAVEGWTDTASITALELALRLEEAGVAVIIYTDIERDGTMIGPNMTAIIALAEQLTTPVIISGGVSCLDDLKDILAAARSVSQLKGVISGRAIYDGKLNLQEALTLIKRDKLV